MNLRKNRGSEDISLEPHFNALSAEFYRASEINKLYLLDLTDIYLSLDKTLDGTTDLIFQALLEQIIILDTMNNHDFEVLSLELLNFFRENDLLSDNDANGENEYDYFIRSLNDGRLNDFLLFSMDYIKTTLSKHVKTSLSFFPYNWRIENINKKCVMFTIALRGYDGSQYK